jgi:glycosyltransferase involved in cell wall biosynthesis
MLAELCNVQACDENGHGYRRGANIPAAREIEGSMVEGKTPQKIMHVILSMHVGGAERLVYDMATCPLFSDNPPAVCCMDDVGELGEKLRTEGYTVHCKGRKPGIDFAMFLWLRDMIKREKADVVHAHQYSPLFYAMPAALLAGGVKVVYTEHGRFYPDIKSWKRTIFNPFLALGVDHLVSISAATARAMAEIDNFPQGKIRVIHNGIDCTRLNPPMDKAAKRREVGLSQTCRVLGTAARLNSIKNIPMMLRVLKLVIAEVPDTCLVIAGQGEEEERLKALALELGIADHVQFIGLRFDLPEMYQLFDVFLLTSFSEGISVTLLEAMASGVPAVVTDVGGNREIVDEGKTGYMVPVDDEILMMQRIIALFQSQELSTSLSGAAQQRVARYFSFQGMMDAYCKLY